MPADIIALCNFVGHYQEYINIIQNAGQNYAAVKRLSAGKVAPAEAWNPIKLHSRKRLHPHQQNDARLGQY
jgi:hypothetical protein